MTTFFIERIKRAVAEAAADRSADPWRVRLERMRGKVDFFDSLERVSSQTLLDLLEVLQRARTASTFRRLAKVMAQLNWSPIRMRDFNGRGYKETIRGYCRQLASDPLISVKR
jgi:hypothetical protein